MELALHFCVAETSPELNACCDEVLDSRLYLLTDLSFWSSIARGAIRPFPVSQVLTRDALPVPTDSLPSSFRFPPWPFS